MITKSIRKQDGGLVFRSHRGNLRHPTSSSSSTQWEQHDDGSRTKVGILGDPHPGLNNSNFLVERYSFSLAEK